MKFVKLKDFIKKYNISRSSIYRLYKKHNHLNRETKLVSNRRLIPDGHIKYFDIELMIEDEKRKQQRIDLMERLCNEIRNSDEFTTELWKEDWDLFGTVSYKNNLTQKSCYDNMSRLFKKLKNNYSHEANFRMLFTTEPYSVRDGYHNHFVLYCSNKKLLADVQKMIKSTYRFDRTDISKYDNLKPGIFYICKQGLKTEHWDYLL